MNILKLNTLFTNYLIIPTIKDEPSGDIPVGYELSTTLDGKVFNALDGAFYVKL